MEHPKVSVLICTRDRPKQLLQCMNSILQLDFESYEIIVVNNGSKNFTIPELAYCRETRFFQQPIAGAPYARNLAVRHARGEILAWIDDDAVAHPQWLRFGVKNFENPEIGCVTGRIVPLELKTEFQTRMVQSDVFPTKEKSMLYNRLNLHPMSPSPGVGCNLLIRSTIAKSHPFREWLGPGTPAGAGEENYLFYKIIQDGWSIFYDAETIVYHDFDPSEDQYRQKMFDYATSRGVYLAWFLLFEKGQRLSTFLHLCKKISGSATPADDSGMPSGIKLKGLLNGPIALLRSLRLARKNRHLALKNGTLLAEFPGK